MLDSTREVLNLIDEHLAKGGQEARELALVISAIRGPDFQLAGFEGDYETDRLKMMTTGVIRARAFPKTVELVRSDESHTMTHMWVINTQKSARIPSADHKAFWLRDGVSYHFKDHIMSAAEVLGIDFEHPVKSPE
jgi:hypothetical protein